MAYLRSLPFGISASILLAASACTGVATNTTGGGRSGVEESKKVADLSSTEAAQFCDFFANQLGGYGYSTTEQCDGGTAKKSAPKSQSSCVDGVAKVPAGCPLTVSDYEGCFAAIAATSACDLHDPPPSCAALSQPGCGSSTTTTVDDAGTADATTTSSCGYRCVNDACTCNGGPLNGRACQQTNTAQGAYCDTYCCH